MKKLVSLTAGLFLLATAAAHANDGIYLGSSLSAYFKDSERFEKNSNDSLVGGINLGYNFENDWSLEANVGTDLYGHGTDQVQFNFYYMFGNDDGSWRPYVLAGVSYINQRENNLAELREDEEETHQAQVGVGLSNMITDHWEIRGDVRLYHKIREGENGTDDGAVSLALNYFFNPPQSEAAPVPQEAPQPQPLPTPEPEPEMRVITIRLNVEFEFDKAVVRAIYGNELNAVANAMRVHGDILLVLEGHADSRGDDDYNLSLSERRAEAVKVKLVEDYGIPTERISTVGYGESRPIDTNETDEGRARNRRVVGELSFTEVEPE